MPDSHTDKGEATAFDRIVDNIAEIEFDNLPDKAVKATKRRLIDLVGCAIAGAGAQGNRQLVEVVRSHGGAPQCSLIGFSGKVNAADAAMINAISARSYDFEVMTTVVADMILPSHTSPTTVMTAFAVAEREQRSGKTVLAALTLGDDLVARVLGGAGFDFGQGWDAASVHAGLGAAAIAAKLSGHSRQQIADSIAMSVNLLGGTIQQAWDGSTDFKLPQGMAARNGVFCADLARAGWTGMFDALQAPYSFYHQFTGGCANPDVLTQALGETYYAEEYFKPYPACAATHGSIETAIALRAHPDFDLARVRRISLRLPARLLTNFCIKPYEPRRFPHGDAIFSYRFQVANVLMNGTTRQEHYEEARLRDPELMDLCDRIELESLSSTDGWAGGGGACQIIATLDDGTVVEQRLEKVSRHPSVRASTDDEIIAKFRQQVGFAGNVPAERADRILEVLYDFEKQDNLQELIDLLGG